ncbi:MAG TPA: hypothetical protein VFW73_09955 [Lacipirellulaceae bacterium]|nr:hypothetical protein [Lacipirellulaceae bacterium]
MTRQLGSFAISPARRLYIVFLVACGILTAAENSKAQVNVTESFDVGAGTRFDLFLNNDVTRPKPATQNDPSDTTVIKDAFGGTRTVVDGGGNILTNHFGFTHTNNAGGTAPGEFGGEFNWFDEGAVADTTLGGEFHPTDPVVIQAKMRLDDIGLDNDQRITLGYYNLPSTPAATDFDRGQVTAGIGFVGGARFLLEINGNSSGAINIPGGFDPDTGLTDTFDVDLTLHFDSGSNMAWFEGTVAGIPINQFTFSNAANAAKTFNSFAIAQSYLREAQDAYRRGVGWVDDLTYSVVSDLGIDNPNPAYVDTASATGNGGDYNGDGVVDAADYVIWRRNSGTSGTPGTVPGDGTGSDLSGTPDGVVDQSDYDFWRSKFGTTVGSGSSLSSASVPEPSLAILLLIGAASIAGSVSRGRREVD